MLITPTMPQKNRRPPISETELAAVTAKLAIQDLAALYMRALDRLDSSLLRAQFWDDAFFSYGIFEGGPDAFTAFCMASLAEHDRNHHMLGQHVIEISGDEAFGEVYYQAYHKLISDTDDADDTDDTDDTGDTGEKRDFFVCGRYVDRYEKRGDIWKISYRSELVDWVRDDPSTDAFLDGTPMIIGSRKPTDPLYDRNAMRRSSGNESDE